MRPYTTNEYKIKSPLLIKFGGHWYFMKKFLITYMLTYGGKRMPVNTELLKLPKVKCKKTLYKSTYEGNAFSKGKSYYIVEENSDVYWIIDNESRKFSISKFGGRGGYIFKEYFKDRIIPTHGKSF